MGAAEDTIAAFLHYHRCGDCNHSQAGDAPHCARCGAMQLQPATSRGLGTIVSYTTVHRASSPQFLSLVPFTIVLVRMDEGFQLMAHMPLTCEATIDRGIRLLAGEDGQPLAVPA